MAFMSPSPMEMIVILVIALLVLGPSRLPDTARSLGRGMRELRDSLQGLGRDDEDDDATDADAPTTRADDPGGLPVDPATVMAAGPPYDDDMPSATEDYELTEDHEPSDDEPAEDEPGGESAEPAHRA